MKLVHAVARFGFAALLLPLVACGSAGGGTGSDAQGNSSGDSADRIIGGTTANGYPEAVLVDMYQNGQLAAYCSGTLIAPKVVLTAGHCVFQFTSWKITAPFSTGKQSATASSGTTYDWKVTSESVDGSVHDLGLIFLDTAINITTYPTLATSALSTGSQIVNVGRINNGSLSTTSLFVSPAITVQPGASSGFPYDYECTDEIQSGDSGGGDFAYGTHNLYAVNSGAGGGTEVLAREDLENAWIVSAIAAHGGSGSTGGTGTGGGSSTGTGGGSSTGGSSTSTGGGSSSTTGGGSTSTCSHDICSIGKKLTHSCNTCAAAICAEDSYCCNNKWDYVCVSEVASICGETCD